MLARVGSVAVQHCLEKGERMAYAGDRMDASAVVAAWEGARSAHELHSGCCNEDPWCGSRDVASTRSKILALSSKHAEW